MLLTYKFKLKVDDNLAIILGHLSIASSKLFNVGNYERKEYKKLGFDEMPNWYSQKKRLKEDIWYKSLPSLTSQDVLARLEESWKSYFTLHYKWEKKNRDIPINERKNEPHSPYYKKDGTHSNFKYIQNNFKVEGNKVRMMIPKRLRDHLESKYQIFGKYFYITINKTFDIIKQIEFSYVNQNTYNVYLIYETKSKPTKKDNKHYISIDIGTKNLMTIYDNNGSSFIISGSSLLNTNYYFSKTIAYYQSIYDKCFPHHKKGETTKRIKHLYELKNKRINLVLHRATRMIVDYSLKHDISKVIVGDLSGLLTDKKEFINNKEKHRYNQNIRTICFKRIYDYLSYKLELEGITLIKQNEAYSSICLPTSKEVSERCANKSYRVKRGLIKCHNYIYNADVVGAYNIMRLYKQDHSLKFDMPMKGLSNPTREYIPVIDQFLNEDYINWNGKSGTIRVSGRNYPRGYELVNIINQSITQMLGNSIAE